MLQQFLKFFVGKAGVADDAFQGIRVEARMAGDGDFAPAVGHAGMLPAAFVHPEANLAEGLDGTRFRNIGEKHAGRRLRERHFHLPHLGPFQFLSFHADIDADGVADIFKSFTSRRPLAVAAGQSRHADIIAVSAFVNNNSVCHKAIIPHSLITGQGFGFAGSGPANPIAVRRRSYTIIGNVTLA